jgi:hypothetical protein
VIRGIRLPVAILLGSLAAGMRSKVIEAETT